MPYIKIREPFDKILDQFIAIPTKGDLEYCIFKLMKIYMRDKKVSYYELHSTVYAAIHCGDEYRRRYLDLRENSAMIENGDVT
jgi:hypothetical protein